MGGEISTSIQLRLHGCKSGGSCRFLNFRNANTVRLTIDAAPTDLVEMRGDVSVRNINFSTIETLDDTGDISKVQPVDIRLGEARISLYDLFGAKGLDLSMGALRLNWGVADGINPTNIVNPYDLEDGSHFDKRLSSLALKVGYTNWDLSFEVIMVPLFMSAILPVEHIDFTALGDPQDVFSLTQGDDTPPEIAQVETPTTTPEFATENIQVAARIRYDSSIGRFGLMFYRGLESLPQASGAVRLTGFQTQNRVDLGLPLVYPRIMMAGFEYRGPIVDTLSLWTEVAVMFPEAHSVSASRNQLEQLVKLGSLSEVPDPIPSQVTQSDDVYVKAVAGLEYIAWEIFYMNLQYVRGLPTERQASDVHDYVLLALRLNLLEGRLVLGLQGALEIAEAGATLGYQATGSISYLHGDAARLSLAATFQGGDDNATFQRFETLSHVKLGLSMGF